MMVYTIRRDVLDLTYDQWNKLGISNNHFNGTAEEFLDKIGLPGGLGAKFNEEEHFFFTEIYELNRKRNG